MQENIIKQLIKVEQGRLKIAVAWEKEKKIPNPETSVIIQSIYKLSERLNTISDVFGNNGQMNASKTLEYHTDGPKIQYGLDNYKD